jgi:hypothetical protein
VFDLGAALQGDESAQLQLADWTFGRNFGEMRRAEYHSGTHAASIGDRMSSEVAKILRSETAEQFEVDYDPRLFLIFRQPIPLEFRHSILTARASR